MKIAEKKQVQNVAPLLAKFSSASVPAVGEKIETSVTETETVVTESQPVAVQKEETVSLQKYNEDIAMRDAETQLLINEKIQAETKVKELETRVQQLEQEKQAAEKVAEEAKQAKDAAEKKVAEAAKPSVAVKPAPKAPAKPVAKPVQKLPPQKSKISDKIYAGDEEVVYCLNYLGQGENQHFVQAAGYYAASVNISEKRYNEIVGIANDYFAHAPEQDMQARGTECFGVITPKDKNKQNQIINSINKAIGL